MKRFVFLIVLLVVTAVLPLFAQRMSPEEFRAKQEAFITEVAELTPEEAARFFPIYFELQSRKKKLMDISWQSEFALRQGKGTEEQYAASLIQMNNARIACDRLDKSYLHRFKDILSYEKIYKVMRSEMKFHREILKGMKK
jgi:hypothetical protein